MDAAVAATTFTQQYTAHPNINAVVTPNDDNANAVIALACRSNKIRRRRSRPPARTRHLSGLQNILKGYQCGTVYKPIYLEAQAAAAMALYLRAGREPPASLVNATTKDATPARTSRRCCSTPTWVTTDNMADTVVKDKCDQGSLLVDRAAAALQRRIE